MQVTIKWQDHMTFEGESGSGHSIILDAAPDVGGRNMGMRPMEMLLLGMGGCTAFDVVYILKKARQQVTGCEVSVEAERAPEIPKVFTKIHVSYTVTGTDISEKQVARAVDLTAEKYCSASIMLAKTATITHEFKIIKD